MDCELFKTAFFDPDISFISPAPPPSYILINPK